MRPRDFSLARFTASLHRDARSVLQEIPVNKRAAGGCPRRRVAMLVHSGPALWQGGR